MATLVEEDVELWPTRLLVQPPGASGETFVLRDDRMLGFAQYGDPRGRPVFFFHAGAGSRLEHPAHVCAIGTRVICTDRPGHGLSSYQPNRKLLDWSDDIAQLADHLGISRFYVLGWSAGGPHALACAHQLPERVLGCAVAAGPAPMNRPEATKGYGLAGKSFIFAARNLPWLVGHFRKRARNKIWGNTEEAKQQLLSSIPDTDKERMLRTGNLDMWFADVREGYRQGWLGVARDDIVIMQDWGFDIADIRVRVDIWHGEQDRNVPVRSGEYMRDQIPNSRATFLPREGHFFLISWWATVVHALMFH